MDDNGIIFEGIGFIGAILILIGFIQQTRGVWTGATWQYEIVNFLGSFSLFIYGMYKLAYPTIMLNFIWLIIALVSLWHIFSGKETKLHHHKKRKGH